MLYQHGCPSRLVLVIMMVNALGKTKIECFWRLMTGTMETIRTYAICESMSALGCRHLLSEEEVA